jgi:hypothetical protein
MRLQYETIKKPEWNKILLVVFGVIVIWGIFFKKDEVIIEGYSQEDVDYKIQIHDLQEKIKTKAQEYDVLEQHVHDFKAQLDSNHAFFGAATDAQVDSSFAKYFDMRHDEVLHVRTGPVDNRGPKLDSN